jgi:hypothetical protein
LVAKPSRATRGYALACMIGWAKLTETHGPNFANNCPQLPPTTGLTSHHWHHWANMPTGSTI